MTSSRLAGPDPAARPTGMAVPLAVAVGGFLGAIARYGVTLAWPVTAGRFPWSTLAVNTSGALAIGLVLGRRWRRPLVMPFLATGVLGAWTTMSTFAVETDRLAADGRVAIAGAYVVATVVLGLGATWVTASLVQRPTSR